MSESPRSYREALQWFQDEQKKPYGSAPTPSGNWGGYCQMDARLSYGIPARDGSAYGGWLAADPEDRYPGTDPNEAPVGSALIFKGGSKGYGHIIIAAFPFPNDVPGAWSNDLKRYGLLDKVTRTMTTEKWGETYVGFLTAINGYDLRLPEAKVAKPKQDKAYQRIDNAINNLIGARETARAQKDFADARLITAEILRLKKMYAELRHA